MRNVQADFFGTVGTYMASIGGLYALTAGHVLTGGDDKAFVVRHRISGATVGVEKLRQRHPDREGFWAGEAAGLLKLRGTDRSKVSHAVPRMHLYSFSSGEPKRLDLENGENRGLYYRSMTRGKGVRVYKDGAATGLTMGILRYVMLNMKLSGLIMDRVIMGQTPDIKLKLDDLGLTLKELRTNEAQL